MNGDDFGYSEAINAAVVRCHDAGVLRSASVLVNRPATRAALALARSRPSLEIGFHVNLTEGAPVLPPREVPSLVDRRGFFRPLVPQLAGLALGRTNLDEVARELSAQFAILCDAGIRPTHVDGHLHAHAFPGVLDVVVRLMATAGVSAMRSPLLGAWLGASVRTGEQANSRGAPAVADHEMVRGWPYVGAVRVGSGALRAVLRVGLDGRRAARLDRAGIVRARYLLDAAHFLAAADPALALADTVAALPGGLVEMMTHPAWNRDATRGAAEVALVTDPRLPELLAARGVRVGRYGDGPHPAATAATLP